MIEPKNLQYKVHKLQKMAILSDNWFYNLQLPSQHFVKQNYHLNGK